MNIQDDNSGLIFPCSLMILSGTVWGLFKKRTRKYWVPQCVKSMSQDWIKEGILSLKCHTHTHMDLIRNSYWITGSWSRVLCLSQWEGNTSWGWEIIVLRKIFVPNRNEVTAEWKRPHNEELCNLYTTPNIIRKVKMKKNVMDWSYSTYGREWRCMQCSSGEPWGKATTWKTWD